MASFSFARARRRRALASLSLVGLAGLVAFASPARAENPSAALVRLLDAPGRRHPLADASGRIPLTVPLHGRDARSLGLLEVAPGVGAARLSPSAFASFSAAHPELSLSVGPPRRALLDVSGQWTHAPEFRKETGLDGKGVVVGVVDTGLDVTHPDFRTAEGKSRVAWMLVAGEAPRGVHKDLEDAFGCSDPAQSSCAVYSNDDIDQLIAASGALPPDVEGHGTHVTSIAAGNGGPSAGTPRFIGIAPQATIVLAAPSPSGGFYDADILKGAKFVFDRADALGMPVVANLSIGGDYGSHDGLSPLETGLSAYVGDAHPGRAIVVAAGNSGEVFKFSGDSGPYGIHTGVRVLPGEDVRVPIVARGATDGQGFVWLTFRPGDEVDVGFEGPGGSRWVGFVGRGEQDGFQDTGAGARSAVVVNNLPKASAALSKETNSALIVFSGAWDDLSEMAVLLRGHGDAELWLTGEQDSSGGLWFERGVQQGTVSLPASAPGLLAVGCTINRLLWTPIDGKEIEITAIGDATKSKPDDACYFSGAGPTPFGVQKPEISAPGGFVAAAMAADADPRTASGKGGLFDMSGCPAGHPYCAVIDDRHAVAAGTSMSAPHVSGAVALLLQMDPTLTQARLTEVLEAGARRVSGSQPDLAQLGPGELDLEGARQALMAESGTSAAPDVVHSWVTISSAYARPDATWPVWGTVELRKADGSIAGGVDGSKLSLAVTGGTVYQEMTKVRPGLFRFAVAGNDGGAGTLLRVETAYDGALIATYVLPIGEDYWSAQDPAVGAVGGCTCRAGAGSGRAPPEGIAASLVGLGLVALASSRRRARKITVSRGSGSDR